MTIFKDLLLILLVALCLNTADVAADNGTDRLPEDSFYTSYLDESIISFEDINSPDLSSFNDEQGLSFFKHSSSKVDDIFLDTPDMTLFKNKLSLCFRRFTETSGEVTYDFVLKTEPEQRVKYRFAVSNIDIKDLRIIFLNRTIKLTVFLDQFFNLNTNQTISLENLLAKADAVAALQAWFKINAFSNISVFETLRKVFNSTEVIENLTPILLGQSIRSRYHILGKEGHGFELINLNSKHDELPEYFTKNPTHIWVMEGVSDTETMHNIFNRIGQKTVANELSLNNKYMSGMNDRNFIMDNLTNSIKREFSAQNTKSSIYSRTIEQMGIISCLEQ